MICCPRRAAREGHIIFGSAHHNAMLAYNAAARPSMAIMARYLLEIVSRVWSSIVPLPAAQILVLMEVCDTTLLSD